MEDQRREEDERVGPKLRCLRALACEIVDPTFEWREWRERVTRCRSGTSSSWRFRSTLLTVSAALALSFRPRPTMFSPADGLFQQLARQSLDTARDALGVCL